MNKADQKNRRNLYWALRHVKTLIRLTSDPDERNRLIALRKGLKKQLYAVR